MQRLLFELVVVWLFVQVQFILFGSYALAMLWVHSAGPFKGRKKKWGWW